MSLISELFASGPGGVITGLVGGVVTSITNFKIQKEKNKHELAMLSAETEAMQAETAANIQITETKVQGDLAMVEN